MDPPTDEAFTDIEEKAKLYPIEYGNPNLSDVTLSVNEGECVQEFKANKTILANRSDVFEKMFFGGFKEANENRVEIKEVSIVTFIRLLDVIYEGKPLDLFMVFKCQNLTEMVTTDWGSSVAVRHCSTDAGDAEVIHDFWRYVTELVAVADRFNVERSVMDCFQAAISNNYCGCPNCFFCLNLFMFSRAYSLDYGCCWTIFSKDNLMKWESFMEDFPDELAKASSCHNMTETFDLAARFI